MKKAPAKKKAVRKQRVPRTRAGGTWTESRYWTFIRGALRKAWSRYPVRFQVLNAASKAVRGKRHKKEFQCNECENWFKQSEVEVDHIKECGSLKDYKDLPRFVKNLFCEEDNLQVLCKPCHKEKTYS